MKHLSTAAGALKEVVRPYFRRAYLHLFPGSLPHYFTDCWQYPSYELGPGLPADQFRAAGPDSAPDVVFFPMNDWHTRMQRSQQLAQAMARLGHRSVYVNPHLGFEYQSPYLASPRSRVSVLGPRMFELHVRLPREHVFHGRMLTRSETCRIAAAAREVATAIEIRRAIQVVSFPIWLNAAEALREALGFPIVYDCHDNLAGFDNIAAEIVAAESRLLAAADLIVFSSARLMETTVAAFPEAARKALLLRNAVDAEHFERPAAAPHGDGKVIGYVGAIESWFDVESVRTAAEEHPGWKFALAGRVDDRRIDALRARPNVSLAGEVPYRDLPEFLARCHAAMIPFLRTELTMATNPIKLYEYFSQGLPVVSARLPEVELHGDLVYLADSAGEFSAQVARAVEESDSSLRERRIAVARQESWTARASQLLGHPLLRK